MYNFAVRAAIADKYLTKGPVVALRKYAESAPTPKLAEEALTLADQLEIAGEEAAKANKDAKTKSAAYNVLLNKVTKYTKYSFDKDGKYW